jgi:hypothetical protein
MKELTQTTDLSMTENRKLTHKDYSIYTFFPWFATFFRGDDDGPGN